MIKPLYDRVLISLIEKEKTSDLIMPDDKSEQLQKGKVIAIGDYNPETNKPLSVKEGDIVLFGKFQGIPVSDSGNNYLVIRERNIEAIL